MYQQELSTVRGKRHHDDFVELTGLDILTEHMNIKGIYYFENKPDIDKLKRSLSRTLDRSPAFAGSLVKDRSRFFIHRNNTGVHFSIINAVSEPEQSPCFPSIPDPALFEPSAPYNVFEAGHPLTALKIVLFKNNRWALTVSNIHSVGDGVAFIHFLSDWSKLYQNRLPKPGGTFPRSAVAGLGAGAGHKPSSSLSLLPQPNFDLKQRLLSNRQVYQSHWVFLPAKEVSALHHYCQAHDPTISCSDVLHALLWKGFCQSTRQNDAIISELYSAINLRRGHALGIPETYIGNAVIERSAESYFGEIRRQPVRAIAQTLRHQVRNINADQVRMDIAYLQREYEAGHVDERGRFSSFVRQSVVDCLTETGLFVNDLRYLKCSNLFFEGPLHRFEVIPELGFNTAYIYPLNGSHLPIQIIAHKDYLQDFESSLKENIAFVI